MNPSKLNQARGRCPCPRKGCEAVALAFTYRARENEKQRRKAGKWYLNCAECGRIEGDGEGMQNYILEHLEWLKESDTAGAAPAGNSPGAPAKAPAKLQKLPALPAPSQPENRPAPAPENPPARPAVWEL